MQPHCFLPSTPVPGIPMIDFLSELSMRMGAGLLSCLSTVELLCPVNEWKNKSFWWQHSEFETVVQWLFLCNFSKIMRIPKQIKLKEPCALSILPTFFSSFYSTSGPMHQILLKQNKQNAKAKENSTEAMLVFHLISSLVSELPSSLLILVLCLCHSIEFMQVMRP